MIKPRLKKTNLNLFVFTCLFFFTILCGLVWSGEPESVGKVVAIRGHATATAPNAANRDLKIKSSVFLNDTIKTTSGRIQIIFKDSTIVTLGRSTALEITKYLWEADNPDSEFEVNVEEGSLRIMGGAIVKNAPENFKTITPSGTIGIRGSIFAARVRPGSVDVLFQGGKGIYVKNRLGEVDITIPGHFTQAVAGKPPEPPAPVDPETLLQLENELAPPDPANQDEADPDTIISDQAEPETLGTVEAEDTPVGDTTAEDTVSEPSDLLTENPLPVSDAVTDSTQETLSTDLDSDDDIARIQLALADLGYSVDPSTSVPSSGISLYSGFLENLAETEFDGQIRAIVNWSSRRILIIEDEGYTDHDHIGLGFGYGTISAGGDIQNVTVLGSDGGMSDYSIFALSGTQTYGHFFGTSAEAFGIIMEGYDVNLQNPSDQEFWNDLAYGILDLKTTSQSGGYTWNGFFIGISEDMSNPDFNRRIFRNKSASSFSLYMDSTSGTYSGYMSGTDYYPSGYWINYLSIGGSATEYDKSVYIDDKHFGAQLNGTGVIEAGGASVADLKNYGNFMITETGEMLSQHTSWGYWEAAYVDPVSGADYHVHVPGSLWIAGEQTTPSYVAPLIDTAFTATFDGKAKGVIIENSFMDTLYNGQVHLDLNFSTGASSPVSGTISFTGHTLNVTSSYPSITNDGFKADIMGASGSDHVNGAFFGPTLNAVGGNFNTTIGTREYHGIFAGDRQ